MENHKSDRDILLEVHGAVERLLERTTPVPELVKDVARHDSELKLLRRGVGGGALALVTGAIALVVKFISGN